MVVTVVMQNLQGRDCSLVRTCTPAQELPGCSSTAEVCKVFESILKLGQNSILQRPPGKQREAHQDGVCFGSTWSSHMTRSHCSLGVFSIGFEKNVPIFWDTPMTNVDDICPLSAHTALGECKETNVHARVSVSLILWGLCWDAG